MNKLLKNCQLDRFNLFLRAQRTIQDWSTIPPKKYYQYSMLVYNAVSGRQPRLGVLHEQP